MTFTSRDRLHLAAIGLILVVAAVIRFDQLWQRGLIFWDEGKFALEGVRYEQLLRMALGLHAHAGDGKAVGTAKPTHALVLGLAYALFGIRDYAGLYVGAASSLVAVGVTYAIGRTLLGRRTALIAAALLAVSAYDVLYARSDLSESDAALGFLLGFWLWAACGSPNPVPWSRRRLAVTFAVALIMSIAFTINYRAAVYITVLVAVDLTATVRARPLRDAAAQALAWLGGLLVAPLAWQWVGVVSEHGGIALFRDELTGSSRGYLAEVLYQLHQGKQSVLRFQPDIYLRWFAARETPFMLGLVVLGLGVLAWRRNRSLLLVAAFWLLPYTVFVFAPFVVPRNLVIALPFVFLTIGGAVDEVLRRLPRWGATLAIVYLAAVLLADGALSWKLTGIRSGFARAATFVEQRGGHALTVTEIMPFYLQATGPDCAAPALSPWMVGLRRQVRKGFFLAVLERHHQNDVSRYIASHRRRIARFLALGTSDLPDDPISSENSSPPPGRSETEYVDIYRLTAAPPRASRAPRFHCRRDRVV